MNTGLKNLIKIAFAVFVAVTVSSCLNNDDEENTYTAAKEIEQREAYLKGLVDKGKDIDTTANGVYYVIREEGEGAFAEDGDTLTVGYAGYLLNGQIFDTSEWHNEEGTYTFILGEDRMISGWEDGMTVMNEDALVEFIIPSELAYGETGQYPIPPYQTLVFVIKMIDIKPVAGTN